MINHPKGHPELGSIHSWSSFSFRVWNGEDSCREIGNLAQCNAQAVLERMNDATDISDWIAELEEEKKLGIVPLRLLIQWREANDVLAKWNMKLDDGLLHPYVTARVRNKSKASDP